MIYAGFWKRFVAMLIDAVICMVINIVLIIPWFVSPLAIIIIAAYHVVFETSPLRGTPGKAVMGISLVKSDGSTLRIQDSLIRFAVSFLSSALLCIGYFMSLFTEKRQTFHDMVADSVVVVGESMTAPNYWDVFVNQSKAIIAKNSQSSNSEVNYAAPAGNPHQSLEELYNLYQKGILTEEEYNNKKAEYLSRL